MWCHMVPCCAMWCHFVQCGAMWCHLEPCGAMNYFDDVILFYDCTTVQTKPQEVARFFITDTGVRASERGKSYEKYILVVESNFNFFIIKIIFSTKNI